MKAPYISFIIRNPHLIVYDSDSNILFDHRTSQYIYFETAPLKGNDLLNRLSLQSELNIKTVFWWNTPFVSTRLLDSYHSLGLHWDIEY